MPPPTRPRKHSEGDEPDEPEVESRWADEASVPVEAIRTPVELDLEEPLVDPARPIASTSRTPSPTLPTPRPRATSPTPTCGKGR
jgi:hypothetical protein